jgi:hypothetical protein
VIIYYTFHKESFALFVARYDDKLIFLYHTVILDRHKIDYYEISRPWIIVNYNKDYMWTFFMYRKVISVIIFINYRLIK